MKFANDAKLRAVDSTSKNNRVIKKPVMIKNTWKKTGEKIGNI